MLSKLFFQHQDRKQLLIALIGSFLGLSFLLTSVHYLIQVNEFGKGADILGPNTIIVQKKVSAASTLKLNKTDFSWKELQKIKENPSVLDVKPVLCNNFDISFETADPMVPRFRTDVFIQSVDPSFLDVKSTKWHWKPGDKFVPIILPRDFLVMLNTFMSASGIPQVSDELAMDIQFKFTLKNDQKKEWVDARIIGFTNEVASILVPESFMNYGNKNFALASTPKITQIMIEGKESEFGSVEKLLQERGLESKNSQMLVGRLKSVVGTLFLVIMVISLLAVFASGLVLIQYMQLLFSRNAYEVRTLIRLGYYPKDISNLFIRYFAKLVGWVCLAGISTFCLVKFLLDDVFHRGGLYISTSFSSIAFGTIILTYCVFLLVTIRTARKEIRKTKA